MAKSKCKVNGIHKKTGERRTLLREVTEAVAENFCEMWGWSYIEADDEFWLEIEKL